MRKVEIGEEFLITKHKKAVAKLIPITDKNKANNANNANNAKQAVLAIKQLRLLNLTQVELNQYRKTGCR